MSKVVVLALLCCGFFAWVPDQEPNEFQAMARHYSQALNAGDAAAIRAYYDERSTIFTPDGQTVRGGSEITAYLGDLMAFINGLGQLELVVEEAEVTGQFAYEAGTFTLTLHSGDAKYSGHYLTVWRKGENGWVVHREISTLPTDSLRRKPE